MMSLVLLYLGQVSGNLFGSMKCNSYFSVGKENIEFEVGKGICYYNQLLAFGEIQLSEPQNEAYMNIQHLHNR